MNLSIKLFLYYRLIPSKFRLFYVLNLYASRRIVRSCPRLDLYFAIDRLFVSAERSVGIDLGNFIIPPILILSLL